MLPQAQTSLRGPPRNWCYIKVVTVMPKRSRASQRQTTASNTYRFFIESGAFHGRDVLIEDGELAHQIGTVLRLRAGERVVVAPPASLKDGAAVRVDDSGR